MNKQSILSVVLCALLLVSAVSAYAAGDYFVKGPATTSYSSGTWSQTPTAQNQVYILARPQATVVLYENFTSTSWSFFRELRLVGAMGGCRELGCSITYEIKQRDGTMKTIYSLVDTQGALELESYDTIYKVVDWDINRNIIQLKTTVSTDYGQFASGSFAIVNRTIESEWRHPQPKTKKVIR